MITAEPAQNKTEFMHLLEEYKATTRRGVIEIGSLTGGSLKYWFMMTTKGFPVASIDLPVGPDHPDYEVQQNGHKGDWEATARAFGVDFRLFAGRSDDLLLKEEVANFMGGEEASMLFIDGGHDMRTVLSDFLLYRHFVVKGGGIIVFHDIAKNHPGSQASIVWEQIKSMNIYPKSNFVEYVLEPDEREFGIGVIRV